MSSFSDRKWIGTLATVTPVAVFGTLVCCALPITLVALGAGSVVATLVTTVPWLTALSRHKTWVFAISGVLLATNYWALFHSQAVACKPGGVCHPSHPVGKTMRITFWASVGIYLIGAFAAYLSLPVALWLGIY